VLNTITEGSGAEATGQDRATYRVGVELSERRHCEGYMQLMREKLHRWGVKRKSGGVELFQTDNPRMFPSGWQRSSSTCPAPATASIHTHQHGARCTAVRPARRNRLIPPTCHKEIPHLTTTIPPSGLDHLRHSAGRHPRCPSDRLWS
jgi:hypothetical protein